MIWLLCTHLKSALQILLAALRGHLRIFIVFMYEYFCLITFPFSVNYLNLIFVSNRVFWMASMMTFQNSHSTWLEE